MPCCIVLNHVIALFGTKMGIPTKYSTFITLLTQGRRVGPANPQYMVGLAANTTSR
jgi:hypothetical protein